LFILSAICIIVDTRKIGRGAFPFCELLESISKRL
jgi:hypothetical protein